MTPYADPEDGRAQSRRWRNGHPTRYSHMQKIWREAHKNEIRAYAKRWNTELKLRVFQHYGMVCSRCGFSDMRTLSIDHLNGGGTQHRKKVGEGASFYVWLEKAGYPEGYQTLCMNCQFIKREENDERHG